MANVLMRAMVVPDCDQKRRSLAHFLDKQEKHRGGWQRVDFIHRRRRSRAIGNRPIRRLPSRNRQTRPENPSTSADPSRIGSSDSAWLM
jgi:hypothetical protein